MKSGRIAFRRFRLGWWLSFLGVLEIGFGRPRAGGRGGGGDDSVGVGGGAVDCPAGGGFGGSAGGDSVIMVGGCPCGAGDGGSALGEGDGTPAAAVID